MKQSLSLLLLGWLKLSLAIYAAEIFETVTFKDSNGLDHIEYAFGPPRSGYPEHALKVYCANIKLRLYWNVYRDQVKDEFRKAIHLRRMARLARHIFDDIRGADRPFNATMLSIVDEYFGVKDDDLTNMIDDSLKDKDGYATRKFKLLKDKLKGASSKDSVIDDGESRSQVELLESNPSFKELTMKGLKDAAMRIKKFVAIYGPKLMLGIYTRWMTMWWMSMSCLFTKYYLWDPALDEFTKLKRSLVMYPDFQLIKLQNIDCKPVKFFQRILDVCKILNPLMKLSFGQFSLDRTTRFKSDMSR